MNFADYNVKETLFLVCIVFCCSLLCNITGTDKLNMLCVELSLSTQEIKIIIMFLSILTFKASVTYRERVIYDH